MKQTKPVYIITILTLAAIIFGLAWAEQITLTTYYPAPYGVYKEFTTTSKTTLATNDLTTDPEAKVGIGIDTPAEKLDVTGIIHATEDVCIDTATGPRCLRNPGGGGSWQHSGAQILNNAAASDWQTLNLSIYGVTGRALVLLKINSPSIDGVAVRASGDTHDYDTWGQSMGTACLDDGVGTLLIQSSTTGTIQWKTRDDDDPLDMWLLGFVRE